MDRYRDMLDMQAPIQLKHRRMPLQNRAAQFMPFAALTGYGASIDEAGRVTEARPEKDESRDSDLDRQLQLLSEHLNEAPFVTIKYFLNDDYKQGGSAVQCSGIIKKIQTLNQSVQMVDGTVIDMNDILSIESDLLDGFF